MRFLSFKEWKINESAYGVWGLQPVSVVGGTMVGHNQPNNPELTYDAWDEIKTNIQNAQKELMHILKDIQQTTGARLGKDYDFTVEKLKIKAMNLNENDHLDVWIEFQMNDDIEEEIIYDGVFRDWNRYGHCKFESDVLNPMKPKIFNIKIENLLKETLSTWFKPAPGEWRCLKESVRLWSDEGHIVHLGHGDKLDLKRIVKDEFSPCLVVEHQGKKYTIRSQDYWWFNWWFEPRKQAYLDI